MCISVGPGILPMIIAGTMTLLHLTAFLINKKIIKLVNDDIKYTLFVIAVVLFLPYTIAFYNADTKNRIMIENTKLGYTILTPQSNQGYISLDTNEELEFELENTFEFEYTEYIQDCIDKGFDINILEDYHFFPQQIAKDI